MTSTVAVPSHSQRADSSGSQVAQRARRVFAPRGLAVRIVGAIVVLFGVVTVTFLLSRVFTADPVNLFVGESASADTRERARQELGLADPIPMQYVRFISGLLHGDLGVSYLTGRPVVSDLLERLPATAELAVYALVGGVLVGIAAGVIAAVNRGGPLDAVVRFLTIAAVSLPQFWIALMMLLIFFVKLHVAPGPTGRLPIGVDPPNRVVGLYTVDAVLTGNWPAAAAATRQLFLPVLVLGIGVFAPIARTTRSAMVQALDGDFIRTARALGVGRSKIWFQYALKNGLLSVVTILAGSVGWVFSGSVLVEGIFGWPGVGHAALVAIQSSDYPVVQGFVLYAAILYVIIFALLDFTYTKIDPRVEA